MPPTHHLVDAVVFQNGLCSFELVEAARLVRGRWPKARILIIRCGELCLEHPLYDGRLRPPVRMEILHFTLSRLTRSLHEEEERNGE